MRLLEKYHHFFFSADNFGIVKEQECANRAFEEFNLLRDKRDITKVVEEIRKLTNNYCFNTFTFKMDRKSIFIREENLGILFVQHQTNLITKEYYN